jgi:hypothetical protein
LLRGFGDNARIDPSAHAAALQFLIVMIASAIIDRLQHQLDYVEDERNSRRNAMPGAFTRASKGS